MKRVLVVDDDGATADGLRLLLSGDGYDVVTVARAQAAIAELGRSSFDAVIADLEMPEMPGVEVVRAARSASDKTVILVVSTYNESPSTREARRAGASRVFTKPVDYDTLAGDLASRLAG